MYSGKVSANPDRVARSEINDAVKTAGFEADSFRGALRFSGGCG